MKKLAFFILGFSFIVLAGCQQTVRQQSGNEGQDVPSSGTFGEAFSDESSIEAAEVVQLFTDNDTVEAMVAGHIGSSCKHSGCWMELEMVGEETLHVTFKDEDFTIPLDAAGKNAVVKGVAIREMIPVETLKNYAREDGKSEEEIAAITEPAWEYEFIASGVIIED